MIANRDSKISQNLLGNLNTVLQTNNLITDVSIDVQNQTISINKIVSNSLILV